MASTNNGQVIQIARGNLEKRLSNKALAKGELFIHTESAITPSSTITDLVTNSTIKKIFTGDLFAGNNNKTEVYSIGSGGALKWGGVLFEPTTFTQAIEKAKQYPNHIFLYNGGTTLYKTSETNDSKVNVFDETQPDVVNKNYVAKDSSEFLDAINPGDLIFYSPSIDQVVALHTSRSTDALTAINIDALVSDSLRNTLLESITTSKVTDEQSGVTSSKTSTLKTYIDTVARHFQYLVDDYGWVPTTATTESTITKDIEYGTVSVTSGTITTLNNDYDGTVHYIPFTDDDTAGLKTYTSTLDGLEDITLHPGDLIFTLPVNGKGGVTHTVVSLYSALLEKLYITTTPERADNYATDIWKSGISGKYTGDLEWVANHSTLKDFIDRLFATKVDIDPVSGKIISSQLPDFLLGAPKYMGHVSITSTDWGSLSTSTTAQAFAKGLLGASNWENLDENEDDTSGSSNSNNVTDSATVNEKLKTGCYWIYTGDTQDISSYTGIFHLDASEDDYQDGEKTSTTVDENAQHLINKGDWIIYNGELEKFEIIDNTSSFIGLLVGSQKVAGIAELEGRELTQPHTTTYNSSTKKIQSASLKETGIDIVATGGDTITFTDVNKVFTPSNTNDLSADYIPHVSSSYDTYNNRLITNSRFKFVKDQSGLYIDYTNYSDTTKIASAQLLWHLDESSLTDSDKEITWSDIYWYQLDSTTFTSATSVTADRIYDVSNLKDGFNFKYLYFMGNEEDYEDTSIYSYSMSIESNPSLSLPQYSGTLTTEGYVNTGFTVIKAIINDVYSKLLDVTTRGHVDWLQTIRETSEIDPRTGKNRKEVFDSKVKQTIESGDYIYLDLFWDITQTDSYAENTSNNYSRLTVYGDITDTRAKDFDATTNYDLGGTGKNILNPSTRPTSTPVENVLPNHSGILLNNNSVIDGGEWI